VRYAEQGCNGRERFLLRYLGVYVHREIYSKLTVSDLGPNVVQGTLTMR